MEQSAKRYATEHSPVARDIMRFLFSPVVENPRTDLYNAARELEVVEILEIAVKQASGHTDLFALNEDEFEVVLLKFRPYLGRCMIERQMDAYNAGIFDTDSAEVSGTPDVRNPDWTTLSRLERKRRRSG